MDMSPSCFLRRFLLPLITCIVAWEFASYVYWILGYRTPSLFGITLRPPARRPPTDFCRVRTPPYPDNSSGQAELRVYVHNWDEYGRFFSAEALRGMERHVDQCQGREPWRAVFVHEERDRGQAHAIFVNGPSYMWSRRTFDTFSVRQKVAVLWSERLAGHMFPNPDVDVEVSNRLSSQVPIPSGCWAVHLQENPSGHLRVPDPATRTRGTAAMISNCLPEFQARTNLLQALLAAGRVDSYGKCLHNKDFEITEAEAGGWEPQKERTLGQYRALLAWENTQDKNYVSEKIFNALAAGVVPVYWGAPDIADFVPESMIINANNYTPETAHLLARQLRRLETDDAYFLSFFRYPQNFSLPERYVAACKREGSFQCAMFRHLWEQRLLPAKRSRLCVPEGKGR